MTVQPFFFRSLFFAFAGGLLLAASVMADELQDWREQAAPGPLPLLQHSPEDADDQELALLSRQAFMAALAARERRLGAAAGALETSEPENEPPAKLDYGPLSGLNPVPLSIGGSVDEPTGRIMLPTDPSLSCPGFYVLRTHAGVPSESGRFGAELLLRGEGRRTLQGGLNFGGRASAAIRGFSAFSIANPRNEQQVVDIGVSVFAPGRLILERRSSAHGDTVYIDRMIQAGQTAISATVIPGFYVVSFQPTDATSTAYGISALTSYVDRAGGGFQGGVVVGGFHDPSRANPATQATGWASFCISEPFEVEVSVLARPTYGSSGSTGMEFSLSSGDGLVFLDSRKPLAGTLNILRGGPPDTNPMAIPVQITGFNAAPYESDLGQWTGPWQAPQAIFDQGPYVNHPDFWSNVQNHWATGTSWWNDSPGQSYGVLIVDLQQIRPIARVSVFQMFGLGKITHIALAGHPHSGAAAPDAFHSGWTPFLPKTLVGPGRDHGSFIAEPSQFTVDVITRYVKIMAYNDGSLGDDDFIDLKGIKMYSPAAQDCSYALSVTNRSHGSCTASGSVQVTTQDGCAWSASSDADWLTITSSGSGSGSGSVSYSLEANNSLGTRSASIRIADQVLTVGQAASECPFPQFTPEIVITSESSFIFEQAGQSALLEAEVLRRCDACPVLELPVSFHSSNPAVVSVSSSGVLTAQTSTPSSAAIEVRANAVPSQVASAVIASYAPGTVFIPADTIIDFDPATGILRLQRNASTEALQPGDILISSDIGGILERVVSVSIQGSVVVLETEPASLLDAFLELDVSIIGPTWEYEAVLEDDVLTLLNAYSDIELRLPLGLKCERENGDPIEVKFTLPSLSQRLSVTPVVDYRITRTGVLSRHVDFLDLNVLGEIGVDITTGSMEMAASVSTKVECKREFGTTALGFVPIVGPVGIAPSVSRSFGFEIEGKASAGTVKFTGPGFSQGVESTMGLAYAHGTGFNTISDYRITGDGLTWPSYDSALNLEFQVKLEPFYKLTANLSGVVGRWPIYDFDFAEAKAYGGAELKMAAPFDWRQFGYAGPEWRLYWGTKGGLDPLFKKLDIFNSFLNRLGVSASVAGISPTLFNPEWPLAASPKPEVEASPGQANIGDEISLNVRNAPSATVDFLAYTLDDAGNHAAGVDLASVETGSDGRATTKWTAGSSDDGRHDIRAMAFAWPFGDIGFPYGSKNAARVEIGSNVQLQIDPSELTNGRIAQQYEFELIATEIPESIEQITFEWNFGVGSPGTRNVQVANGEARTVVSQVYDAAGNYTLSARVRHQSETLATATAEIHIEGVVLNISPPGLSNGEVDVEYEFEFIATGLSDDMGNVVFNWSFGDGVAGVGQQSAPVSGGQASISRSYSYSQQGGYGLYVDVSHADVILAQLTVSVVIGEVDETEEELDICDQWSARLTGRQGVTVNTWDISQIPEGSVFDIRFDAYSIPDKYVVEYEGNVVLDTGWRGSQSEYNRNPLLYPGGLSGPGFGRVYDFFRKRDSNSFRVTVYGPDSGTRWEYNVRCRAACDVTLDPVSRTHSSQQEQGPISIIADDNCEWTVSTTASWIQVSATGSGNRTINYTVQQNNTGLERSGVIRVGGASFLVTQSASDCDFAINPSSRDHGGGAETGTVAVSADSSCAWTATSNAGWINITAGNSGTGDGVVSYAVQANTGSVARTGTLTIAGQTFTVNQSACETSISPTSRSHGSEQESGAVNVTAGSGCEWTAASNVSWLNITSGSSGTGDGVVNYSVAANADPAQRTGTLTIAGHTFTVTQQGGQCSYAISPTSRSHGPGGENGTVWVSADPGCEWTASSNAGWISIVRGASGTGDDTVRYSVSANTGSAARTGTLSIAGHTFTVTQSAVVTTSSITGRVLQNGEPERDVELQLWREASGQWTRLSLVKSGSDGYFAFTGVPGLSAGQRYMVQFSNGDGANTPADINRLGFWRTYFIEGFTSGSALLLLPFEIGNIALQAPTPGATVTLPRTFTWTPRSHQAPSNDGGEFDDYEFNLYEDQDNFWYSDLLGSVGSYRVDSLPPGFVYGTQYRWFVYIWADEGYGSSWQRTITFE